MIENMPLTQCGCTPQKTNSGWSVSTACSNVADLLSRPELNGLSIVALQMLSWDDFVTCSFVEGRRKRKARVRERTFILQERKTGQRKPEKLTV